MNANANPYLVLGVRPFINCCSVRTMHGGSLMLPQVREAMAEASRHFVNLDELMEAAGQRLAALTGAEWGIVTCGSAAAVALGTAACVAALAMMTFMPFPFIHPLRVRRYRAFNIAVLVLWAVLAIGALARDLMPPAWVTIALCAIGVYVVSAGLFRTKP